MSVYDVYRGEENEHVPEEPNYSDEEIEEIEDKEEEAKTLNTSAFQQNINREEFEYSPSNGYNSSHSVNRIAGNQILYQFRYKTLWFAVIIGFVSSFLAMSLSVYSVIKYNEAAKELRVARENRGKVCLPCDRNAIQQHAWKQSTDVTGECCVGLEELLFSIRQIAEERSKTVVREAMEKQMAKFSSSSSTNGVNTKISAHIALGPVGKSTNVIWQHSESELIHISEGIDVERNGRLKVNIGGYYYIYSQLGIFYRLPDASGLSLISSKVYIEKPDTPGATILLQADDMKWKSSTQTRYSTQMSSTSGIMYIPSGSTIYTSERNLRDNIDSCTIQKCFFGLFKL